MEELYQQLIREEASKFVKKVDIPDTLYQGEHAFLLLLQCVQPYYGGYRFKVTGLKHETLLSILVVVRNIIVSEGNIIVTKRSRILSELKHLGMNHLCKYIKEHKNKTYTLDIKPITYEQIRFICKALFSW